MAAYGIARKEIHKQTNQQKRVQRDRNLWFHRRGQGNIYSCTQRRIPQHRGPACNTKRLDFICQATGAPRHTPRYGHAKRSTWLPAATLAAFPTPCRSRSCSLSSKYQPHLAKSYLLFWVIYLTAQKCFHRTWHRHPSLVPSRKAMRKLLNHPIGCRDVVQNDGLYFTRLSSGGHLVHSEHVKKSWDQLMMDLWFILSILWFHFVLFFF